MESGNTITYCQVSRFSKPITIIIIPGFYFEPVTCTNEKYKV